MDYDNMPAGREMDSLIAEKIMGICLHKNKISAGNGVYYKCVDCGDDKLGRDVLVKQYSKDITAAWKVIDNMLKDGFDPCVNFNVWSHPWEWHTCFSTSYRQGVDVEKCHYNDGYADTAPLAICRAALKAVDSDTTPKKEGEDVQS